MRESGLVCGYVINDQGCSSPIDLADVPNWKPEHGFLWLHFDIREAAARDWLALQSGLSDVAIHTLLCEETRPHVWREHNTVVMADRKSVV